MRVLGLSGQIRSAESPVQEAICDPLRDPSRPGSEL
jgi:hypothetical protein